MNKISINEYLFIKRKEFFNDDNVLIPEYTKKISLLKHDKKDEKEMTSLFRINEDIKELKSKVFTLKNDKKKYYLENYDNGSSPILFTSSLFILSAIASRAFTALL